MLKNKLLSSAAGVLVVCSVITSLSAHPIIYIAMNPFNKFTTTMGAGYGFKGLGSIEFTGSFGGGLKYTKSDMYKSLGDIIGSIFEDKAGEFSTEELGEKFLNDCFAGLVSTSEDGGFVDGKIKSEAVVKLDVPNYKIDSDKSYLAFKPLYFGMVGHFSVWKGFSLDAGLHLNFSKVNLKASLNSQPSKGAAEEKITFIEHTCSFKPRKLAPYFGVSYTDSVYKFSNHGNIMFNTSVGFLWQGKFSTNSFKYKDINILAFANALEEFDTAKSEAKGMIDRIQAFTAFKEIDFRKSTKLSFTSKLLNFMPVINVGLKLQL